MKKLILGVVSFVAVAVVGEVCDVRASGAKGDGMAKPHRILMMRSALNHMQKVGFCT